MMKKLLLIIAILKTIGLYAQEPRLVLPTNAFGFSDAFFSPDKKRILTNNLVWDEATGALLFELPGSMGGFSPQGDKIVTLLSSSAKIWKASDGSFLRTIAHDADISIAAFSPDGDHLLTASYDRNVRIWDVNTGQLVHTFDQNEEKIVDALYSPDGKKIAVLSETFSEAELRWRSLVITWDAATGKQLNKYDAEYGMKSIAFSPVSDELLAYHRRWGIMVTKDSLLTPVITFERKPWSDNIRNLGFAPGSNRVVGLMNDTLRFWDIASRKLVRNISDSNGISKFTFTKDGTRLFIADTNRGPRARVTLLDLETGNSVKIFDGHSRGINNFFLSADEGHIITTSRDKTARIYDVSSGIFLKQLKGHTRPVLKADLLDDGKYLATYYWEGNPVIWDLTKARIAALLRSGSSSEVSYHPRQPYVLVSGFDGIAEFNYKTGELLWQINDDNYHKGYYSPDGKRIVLTESKKVTVISSSGKKKLWEYASEVITVHQSPDSKRISIESPLDNYVLDAITGKTINRFYSVADCSDCYYTDLRFSPDSKVIIRSVIRYYSGVPTHIYYQSLDAATGKRLYRFNANSFFIDKKIITAFVSATEAKQLDLFTGKELKSIPLNLVGSIQEFSEDLKHYCTNDENFITVRKTATGEIVKKFTAEKNSVLLDIDFKRDILLLGNMGALSVVDMKRSKPIVTLAALDSTDELVIVPEGYYKITPAAARLLHYVTDNYDVITFDQLDIKYNRPDKVLNAVGSTDSLVIEGYKRAYLKRVSKLKIDTAQFINSYLTPSCDIYNRSSIPYLQNNRTIELHIRATDSFGGMQRFNVWVNDTRIFGEQGISISSQRSRVFDTIIPVTLSSGENRIEASVTNVNGMESFRKPLFVKYTPAIPTKEKQYYIGIGINQFADPAHNLQWSVNDIQKLAVKLKEKYPDIIIDTLFDASVTKENILVLRQKLLQLDVDDKVVISYSGHGVLSKEMDYYLSTYNMNFKDPAQGGLAYDELEKLIDGIGPRKKLVLIDACHSGEVDKEEIEKIDAATKILDSLGTKKDTANRSSIVIRKTKLGMHNSFELMQSLFMNVSRGSGATVISAAGGMQYAQERGELQSGVFTYSIIDAFNRNATLTVSQLKKIVGESVIKLTNGLQKPTSRNETNSYDWVVW